VVGLSSDAVKRGLYAQLQTRNGSTTIAIELVTGGYEP
jgi:hypothetical protein